MLAHDDCSADRLVSRVDATFGKIHPIAIVVIGITKRCASQTKTRLLPLNKGNSNVDTMTVVADPATDAGLNKPGGGSSTLSVSSCNGRLTKSF